MGIPHTVIFVLLIIIACNAVLYPSLFSSIFRMWFGYPAAKEESEKMPDYPPHMRGRMHSPGGSPQPSGDKAGYLSRQRQEGSGHGMMGTILPFYAFGIFIYFGYIIHKIFLKPKPKDAQRDPWAIEEDEGPTLERQQEENLQRQLAAELRAANYDGLESHRRSRMSSPRAEAPPPAADVSDVDLLKRRMEQTERTMDKMMEMMNNMGVAFSKVTQKLDIDVGVESGDRAPEMEEDPSSEDDEGDDWSESSEVLEGCRVSEDEDHPVPQEKEGGMREVGKGGELVGKDRIQEVGVEGIGEAEENAVRRRKVTAED